VAHKSAAVELDKKQNKPAVKTGKNRNARIWDIGVRWMRGLRLRCFMEPNRDCFEATEGVENQTQFALPALPGIDGS
jgi:hypothetical protein